MGEVGLVGEAALHQAQLRHHPPFLFLGVIRVPVRSSPRPSTGAPAGGCEGLDKRLPLDGQKPAWDVDVNGKRDIPDKLPSRLLLGDVVARRTLLYKVTRRAWWRALGLAYLKVT